MLTRVMTKTFHQNVKVVMKSRSVNGKNRKRERVRNERSYTTSFTEKVKVLVKVK